ncbi:MAG TPA: hypothetical protein VLH08_01150, partial [Acidobacteriota bacterium]|nr:hypothetical protein [Acidobacteriota bacterium]
PAAHDARTAWNGTMLAMAGIILMFITHVADVARQGPTHAGWFFDTSPWLIVPLLLYVFVLYPILLVRANRAKQGGVSGHDLISAKKATSLTIVLLFFTAAYLVCVFLFSKLIVR